MGKDFKIVIPGRVMKYINSDRDAVVRIGKDQYNFLVDLYNESSLTMKDLLDTIIDQAKDHIVVAKFEELRK